MSVNWFDERLKSLLVGCNFDYSSFPNGDFGSLERVEVEGGGKLATVDVWSEGWVGFDIYDCVLDEQVMNVLLSPDEKDAIPETVEKFVRIMSG